MWTSVYMTQSIDTAKEMRRKIEDRNIPVMLRSISIEESGNQECYELLVPKAELNEALEIIIDL